MRTEYLLEDEVRHVLAALTPWNRLVAEVCLETGLRVGDVLHITRHQLYEPNGFEVEEAKTGNVRWVTLSPVLRARILAEGAGIPTRWAFPGRDPAMPRTRQAVWQDVKRAARCFRMKRNVGPHSLRKVYAVRLMHRYGDIERVRHALGHEKPETTMIYALADKLLEDKGLTGGG